MRHLRIVSVALTLTLLSFACSQSVLAQAKPVELTYAQFQPANHFNTKLSEEWAKEIEKRTNGRVKITVFSGGTLSPADKSYTAVVTGVADIAQSCMAYTRGKFPLSEVIDLPLGYKRGIEATRLINKFYAKFKPAEYDETQVMYFMAHGPGIVHSKKPVSKLEDLKGQKVRCTGLAAKVVGKLGGVPVAMPMGETYDALSRGVVDATMAPQEAAKGWRWGEVTKATTQSYGSGYSTGFFIVMNKAKWNSLPADVKKIIEKVNEEWIDKTGNAWDQADKEGRDFMTSLGKQIIPLSAEENARWAKLVAPLLEEYTASMKAKGLPGKEALDFCLAELKKMQQ